MDVKLVNPFISATVNVLETMASIKCKALKPYLKKNDVAEGDVTGIVGITGDTNGTISVTFEEKVILQIVSKMLMEEINELNTEVHDAVGELTNMISGQARKKLSEIDKVFKAATPSVISGKKHKIVHYNEGPMIAIPFTTDYGSFTIEVCLE